MNQGIINPNAFCNADHPIDDIVSIICMVIRISRRSIPNCAY